MKDPKIIEATAQATAERVVSELKRQGLMKDNKQTPFQKTETLLYNYENFKAAITGKMQEIEEVRIYGVPKRSPSVGSFSGNPTGEVKSDAQKTEEKIEAIENSIQTTKNFIRVIDNALAVLKDDPYFPIIRMKYFEGKTREEIADYFEVDASTISRNKNRLINLLQIRLFSDEVIYKIFS